MSGNTPNVSRNTFDITKEYQRVSIQQGVPVMDCDLNEAQDNLRIWIQLLSEYVIGSFRVGNAFNLNVAGTPSNVNFEIVEGWALIEGALVSTTKDDPPVAIEYIDDENYIVSGTVTAINGGLNQITDTEQKFQAFMDLLATANHGACYVLMTSGAESGNTFNITAYTSTILTLGAGIGAIAPGDTFIVKPPVLTVPGGYPRTDVGYLVAWWEDIAEEEDSVLTEPTFGIETAHRSKLRWTFRVDENTTSVPATPTSHGFGVRYLKCFTYTRTTGDPMHPTLYGHTLTPFNTGSSFIDHFNNTSDPHSVTASQVTFTPVGIIAATDVQAAIAEILTDYAARVGQDIGINTDYLNGALTDAAGGGLGDLDPGTLQDAMTKIDTVVQQRRAFTAVMTDGTESTNGDYNGVNAMEGSNDFTYGGRFLVRRGNYQWNAFASLRDNDSFIGEMLQWSAGADNSTTVAIPVTSGVIFTLKGYYENLFFTSFKSNLYYQTNGVTLRNVNFQPGTGRIVGNRTSWKGGEVEDSITGAAPTSAYTFVVSNSASPHGDIENVSFGTPPSGGAQTAVLYMSGVGTTTEEDKRAFIFRNCKFDASAAAGCHALYLNGNPGPIIFDGCTFIGSDGGYCVQTVGSSNDEIEFRNCTFQNDYGTLINATTAILKRIKFRNCKFRTGSSSPSVWAETIKTDRVDFYDCYIRLGASSVETNPASVSAPIIHIGYSNGECTIKNMHIFLSGAWHGYTPVVIEGGSVPGYPVIVEGLIINELDAGPAYDRTTNGALGRAGILDLVGDNTTPGVETSGLICKDIQLNKIGTVAAVTDNGTIVAARNCEIDGLTIDGDVTPGGGSVGAARGALYMVEDVKLRNFIYCPTYDINITAEVVWMNTKCIIDGGIIHRMGTNYTGSFFRVDSDETDCIVQNLTCPEILTWQNAAPIMVGWANCHRLVMHNNSFTFSGAGPHNSANALIHIPAGQTCRISNNSIFITRSVNIAINMGGVNCLADGNVVDYNAGGGTPSITNGGVGAVTGDNVLAA